MKLKVQYTETIRREAVIEASAEVLKEVLTSGISLGASRLEGLVIEMIANEDVVSDDEIDSGFGGIESIEELK